RTHPSTVSFKTLRNRTRIGVRKLGGNRQAGSKNEGGRNYKEPIGHLLCPLLSFNKGLFQDKRFYCSHLGLYTLISNIPRRKRYFFARRIRGNPPLDRSV